MGNGKRYFEFVEGSSNKFWEIWSDGNQVFTRYGKIGASGQTTVKDEGSPAAAQKLYDKLVKEKTGKGYEEKTAGAAAPAAASSGVDYKARWATIAKASGKELVAALEKEWEFLCDTPACKAVLQHTLTKVKSASVEDGRLVVVFDNQYDGETAVRCSPPATKKLSAYPKSWQKFMSHYDGMEVDADLDVPIFFNGTSGSGGFDQSYVEEVEPELYEKAQDKEIEFEVPIDKGQDWVLANPFKKNKLGEPALYFFSHEGGGLDSPYPPDLGVTGVFLRIMCQDITDKDFFESVEADEDSDEDSDDDEAEDSGGGATRRFEFAEGSSNKFWEITLDGSSHTVRFGKIGTDGQEKTKEFDSAAEAKQDYEKLIAEKTKKGYEEVEE